MSVTSPLTPASPAYPPRHRGWVGRSGKPLVQDVDGWLCPDTGERYALDEGVLTRVG